MWRSLDPRRLVPPIISITKWRVCWIHYSSFSSFLIIIILEHWRHQQMDYRLLIGLNNGNNCPHWMGIKQSLQENKANWKVNCYYFSHTTTAIISCLANMLIKFLVQSDFKSLDSPLFRGNILLEFARNPILNNHGKEVKLIYKS
jgi:hypothetical protein